MKEIKAACITFKAVPGQIETNLEKLMQLSSSAKIKNARLILFGELSLTGYTTADPKSIAINRDHKVIHTLFDFSKDNNITLCYGFAEIENDKLYITTCITDGKSQHFYRKIHLGFAESKVFTAGEEIKVFESDDAVYGISACIESHIPPLFEIYRKQGAEIMLLPYAAGMNGDTCKSNWSKVLPARANDNGVYILACNLLKESSGGGMCILNPKGNVIDEFYNCEEHMIICSLPADLPRNHPDGDMRCISYFDRQKLEIYEKYL